MRGLVIGGLGFCLVALTGSSAHAPSVGRSSDWISGPDSHLAALARAEWGRHNLEKSALLNERGYLEAMRRKDRQDALRFLAGAGACRFLLFQYSHALEEFKGAQRLAVSLNDRQEVGALSVNIASLYLATHDPQSALLTVQQGLAAASGPGHPSYWTQLSVFLGQLSAERGDRGAALSHLREAVTSARELGDAGLEAFAWDHLGNELLRENRLKEAEQALADGFRIRVLRHDRDVFLSYATLAELKLRQGDLQTARSLIDEAISASSRERRSIPLYIPYHQRGEIRVAQGDLAGALCDFRKSLDLARRWRLDLIPVDSVRTGSDVTLNEIYSSFVETGSRLYFQQFDKHLAYETLAAEEESRATSLREKLAAGSAVEQRLTKDYWAKLAELRDAEPNLMASEDPATRERTGRLQLELTEMESAAGLPLWGNPNTSENIPTQNSLIDLQKELGGSEAFLSFHLGEQGSYLWAVTRQHLRLFRLRGRQPLALYALQFADAVRRGDPEAEIRGRELYSVLFGELDREILNKRNWLFALDDALFEAPLAALVVERRNGKSVYLVEQHSIQLVPSALLLTRVGESTARGRFVGIGDAIYNTADPRWRGRVAAQRRNSFTFFPRSQATAQGDATQLSRLVSSGWEIASCARTASEGRTGANPIVLLGKAATFDNFRASLVPAPRIIHLATHVVDPGNGQPRIALSLRSPASELVSPAPELVSTAEVSMLRIPGSLVVMSGCSSGAGKILPGAGLLGLSRAWLAAGASAVVASHWPTPDDTGELFLSFYRRMRDVDAERAPGGAAEALRDAQLDMLHSNTWRSAPEYWAAYFAIGGAR